MQVYGTGPVVVIGAGLAGLAAAWRLHAEGRDVVVLEAGSQIGGRTTRSLAGWHGGQYANLGGELIDRGYHALRGLCAEVGVRLLSPQAYSAPEPDDASAMEGFLRVARFVVGNELLDAKTAKAVGEELRTAARTTPPATHEVVEQWIRRSALSERAAGATRALARFFTQLEPWDCDVHFVFGAAEGEFQRVEGGTVELPLALSRDLDVRLEQRVVKVERGRSPVVVLDNGERMTASRVICAVGPFALPGLGFDPPLSDDKIMTATSLLPAMAGKVMVQYAEGDAVRDAFGSLVCTDGDINSAWVSVPSAPGEPAIVTSFFAGAARGLMRSEATAFATLDELVEKVVGGPVHRLHGEVKNWWRDPFAMAVTVAPASSARDQIAAVLAAPELDVRFAGDYTDAPMSGTLEGAVRSGLRAAQEVLRAAPTYHTDMVTERLSRA